MADTATWPTTAPSAMTPVPYRVRSRIGENRDSATLQLEPVGEPLPAPLPGEFMMMYAFGIGEVAISVSGVPAGTDSIITHTIRSVGAVSRALHDAQARQRDRDAGPVRYQLGVGRGRRTRPGHRRRRGWLAPLRPVVLGALADRDRYSTVTLIAGARSGGDFLFDEELRRWTQGDGIDVHLTVDLPVQGWPGEVGFVTEPLRRIPLRPEDATAFLCGPSR